MDRQVMGWREVGDGVLVRRYELFDQNIVVVRGHGALLVVDTRTSHRAARELQEDIRRLTPDPWTVVNTHHHYDHSFGNAMFAPADIWGHERCASAMRASGERVRRRVARDMPELAEELAEVEIAPPNRTFGGGATLDLGGRRIELRHLGRAHTDDDVIVVVHDGGVVVAGDVIEEGSPPYFGDSFPLDWPETNLRLIEVIGQARVVPGHGDVVDREFVEAQTRDLATAADLARAAHARPDRLEEERLEQTVASMPFPPPFARQCLDRAFAQLDGSG